MSLFEDLIEELKEENLIEETVIETSKNKNNSFRQTAPDREKTLPENLTFFDQEVSSTENIIKDFSVMPEEVLPEYPPTQNLNSFEVENHLNLAAESPNAGKIVDAEDLPAQPIADKDFYRRRATEEVTSLQIVEHILTGVEREQMKIPPKSYDDIPVSLALHDFLKITGDPNSSEHSLAEFKLMGETENWHSALLRRDKFVAVGDLRRYCESTRAPLSSQALAALARFYRNSPFSESVRNKFDLIMTRLVTKELKNHKREILFSKEELRRHLSDLYADWSSVPLYAADDDSEVLLAVLKFEDFSREAEETNSFEALIEKDFFNRLRIFKDSVGENFFSPLLTATAIECNVIVGNRYVELIDAEREAENSEILEEKYNFLLDQPVSDATSKTFQLVEILKIKKEEVKENKAQKTEEKEEIISNTSEESAIPAESEIENSLDAPPSGKRKLLLIVLIAVIVLGGLYFLTKYFANDSSAPAAAEKINRDDSEFGPYFKATRISENTFYAVTLPAWEDLSDEAKEDVLQKILAAGAKRNYKNLQILNPEGKIVGSAAPEKGIELASFQ